MIKKIVRSIPLVIFLIIGVSVNYAYYVSSFVNSGYGSRFSYFLASYFMLLEVILWGYVSKKKWYLNILKFSILFYSIFITMSGQYFSTSLVETSANKAIQNTSGYEEEIQDYREQIAGLNTQIESYIEQQRIFGTNTNREDRERAESKRDELEGKLDTAREAIRSDSAIIEIPKTAYDLFSGWTGFDSESETGISPESIRFIFQLFASVLLALVAPISLSILRIKNPGNNENVELPYDMPEKQSMDIHDKSQILKMICYYMPNGGKMMKPEKATEEFSRINKANNSIKAYSVEECSEVYNEIFRLELQDKTAEEIKKGMIR